MIWLFAAGVVWLAVWVFHWLDRCGKEGFFFGLFWAIGILGLGGLCTGVGYYHQLERFENLQAYNETLCIRDTAVEDRLAQVLTLMGPYQKYESDTYSPFVDAKMPIILRTSDALARMADEYVACSDLTREISEKIVSLEAEIRLAYKNPFCYTFLYPDMPE